MLILGRAEIASLLDAPALIDAVERAFAQDGAGRTLPGARVVVPVPSGAFHVAVGGLAADEVVVAAKVNARLEAPAGGGVAVRGSILLVDGSSGERLALLDSAAITVWRTAAVAAVAARRLAGPRPARLLAVGAGRIAEAGVEAIAAATPVAAVRLWSRNAERAVAAAGRLRARGLDAEPVQDLRAAARASDTILTATASTEPLLAADDVPTGALVLAFGADAPGKGELAAELVAAATVVVDSLPQCRVAGELQHPLAAGLMSEADVYARLGEIVAGGAPPPDRAGGVTVFDATGMAIQDAAAGLAVLRRARERGVGLDVALD